MTQHREVEYTATFHIPEAYPRSGAVYLKLPLSVNQDYHDSNSSKFNGIIVGIITLADRLQQKGRRLVVNFEVIDTFARYNLIIESINFTRPDQMNIDAFTGRAYTKAKQYGDQLIQNLSLHLNKLKEHPNIKLWPEGCGINRWDAHIFSNGEISETHQRLKQLLSAKYKENGSEFQSEFNGALTQNTKIHIDTLKNARKMNPSTSTYFNKELTEYYVQESILELIAVMLQWNNSNKEENKVWLMSYSSSHCSIDYSVFERLMQTIPKEAHYLLLGEVTLSKKVKHQNHAPTFSPIKKIQNTSENSQPLMSGNTRLTAASQSLPFNNNDLPLSSNLPPSYFHSSNPESTPGNFAQFTLQSAFLQFMISHPEYIPISTFVANQLLEGFKILNQPDHPPLQAPDDKSLELVRYLAKLRQQEGFHRTEQKTGSQEQNQTKKKEFNPNWPL